MKRFFAACLVTTLYVLNPVKCHSDILVEYSFADANSSVATNTGSLGANANGVISGGSIIASPLSPDGFGLLLDGMNGSGISVPNAFEYGDEVSVEALVRLDALNGQNSNIIFDDFGGPGVLLSVNSDGFLRFTVSTIDGDATIVSASIFPLASWHHVAGVYDGSEVRLSVDHQLVASIPATGSIVSNPDVTPHVGLESGGSVFPWNGAIDDFRVHDRAISLEVVVPDSFTVTRGDYVSGGPIELAESDNLDLSLRRSNSDVQSRTEFEVKGISPTATPTRFEFTLEGVVFARSNVVQTIELFDYGAAAWELVSTNDAARVPTPDSVVTVAATGDLSRFVEAGTMCIEARVRFQSDSARQRFASNTDQTVWTIGL